MKRDKLIIKTKKQYSSNDLAVRIPIEIATKIKDIGTETNRDMKSLVAEMLEFALDRIELQ